MKKIRNLLILGLFLSVFSVAEPSYAESTNASFNVESGELRFLKVRPIQFETITYSANGGNYKGYIEDSEDYGFDTLYYLKDPVRLPGEPIDPEPFAQWVYSLIDIEDNRIENNSWTLSVSRTPFVNSKTGHQLSGTRLSLINGMDNSPYFKGSDYQINDISLDDLGTSSTVAASYSGESARGLHLISFFKNRKFVGEEKQALGPNDFEGGPYLANDINLYLPPNLDIEEGNYTSTMTWTLGDLP